MSREIVKQPNGLYCIFSSIVDDVIVYDATPEELIKFRIEEETETIKKYITETIKSLNEGNSRSMPYEELCRIVKIHHNKDYSNGITE